jgi:hypothetical protein
MSGMAHAEALATLRGRGIYHPEVLDALADYQLRPLSRNARAIWLNELAEGMIVDQDVVALNGVLLLARGQEVTESVISRLQCFRLTQGLVEPLRVQLSD